MTRPLIVRAAAEADLERIHLEYEAVQVDLGNRFLAQLRQSLERIEAAPELYRILWRDVRAVRVRKFRHVVYYVAFADRVEVIGVVHGARDANVWRSRV